MIYEAMIAGGGIGLLIGFAFGIYVGYTASWARFVRKYVTEQESSEVS